MVTKSTPHTTNSTRIPIYKLQDRIVYLPGVTYRTIFSKPHGLTILSKFVNSDSNISNKGAGTAVLKDKKIGKYVRGIISRNQEVIGRKHGDGGSGKLDALSKDAVDGVGFVNRSFKLGLGHCMIVGFLPGFKYDDGSAGSGDEIKEVVTICKIMEIHELDDKIVLSLRAVTRGEILNYVNDDDDDAAVLPEANVIIDFPDSVELEKDEQLMKQSLEFIPSVLRLFENVTEFVNQYNDQYVMSVEDAGDSNAEFESDVKNAKLRYLLLRLSPISGLLYSQLSPAETLNGLARLKNLYKSYDTDSETKKLTKYFQYNDVLTALFPFSVKQKVLVLSEMDYLTRLLKFMDNVNFANELFEETLNTDFILESWKNLDNRLGTASGDILRTQFVSNHLKNLRLLVDQIGSSSPSKTASKTGSGRASSFKSGQGGSTDDDNELQDIADFIDSLDDLVMSEDGKRLVKKDFKRISQMQASSSDYQVLRSYLEVIMDLPWVKKTKFSYINSINIDNKEAKRLLDNDHYGMDNVKERILEYVAVLKLHERINKINNEEQSQEQIFENQSDDFVLGGSNKSIKPIPKLKTPQSQHQDEPSKAPILLLTGPPGVGKTSLAKSIASTLGRKFQRISVGGLNDFADLKGHRRTYVGAIPGLIIQALRRSQTMNPVILLDEVDKIGSNSRKGDPEAALLEILDPEQNTNFQDLYVGFPIDLSQVLFICTANNQWELSEPLRDRMEVIELSGYNYFEKIEIVKRYVIPRQISRNALPLDSVILDDDTILKIAVNYTRESGVRNLERLIGSICRTKAVEYTDAIKDFESLDHVEGYDPVVSVSNLPKYIGIPPHLSNADSFPVLSTKIQQSYGLVNGLSYNSDGSGSLLKFEMVGLPGSQSLMCTGRLGEVLLESSQIANTLVGHMLTNKLLIGKRGYSIDDEEVLERYKNLDIHLHVPEGAISKDGPSAGITMTLCLLSLVLEKPVSSDIAMTGEITLTGKVFPIGGLKEKMLGAHLTGKINKVLVPRMNRKDVIDDYVHNLKDKEAADQELTSLILEEEKLLKDGSTTSYNVYGMPEKWIREKLGLEIVYVNDFTDVLAAVWDGEVCVKGDETDLLKERSHL